MPPDTVSLRPLNDLNAVDRPIVMGSVPQIVLSNAIVHVEGLGHQKTELRGSLHALRFFLLGLLRGFWVQGFL